jgi:hypothetical protein
MTFVIDAPACVDVRKARDRSAVGSGWSSTEDCDWIPLCQPPMTTPMNIVPIKNGRLIMAHLNFSELYNRSAMRTGYGTAARN